MACSLANVAGQTDVRVDWDLAQSRRRLGMLSGSWCVVAVLVVVSLTRCGNCCSL